MKKVHVLTEYNNADETAIRVLGVFAENKEKDAIEIFNELVEIFMIKYPSTHFKIREDGKKATFNKVLAIGKLLSVQYELHEKTIL